MSREGKGREVDRSIIGGEERREGERDNQRMA